MKLTMRVAALNTAGTVLPRPWNTAEHVNTKPDAMKFKEMRFKNCVATATAPGSDVNARTSHSARHWQSNVNAPMITAPMSAATRLVSFVIPAVWLTHQPQFRLVQLWYVSIVSMTVQAIVSLWLVRSQLRRRVPASAAALEAG